MSKNKEKMQEILKNEQYDLDTKGYYVHRVVREDENGESGIDFHTHGLWLKHGLRDIRLVTEVPATVVNHILERIPANMINGNGALHVYQGQKVYDDDGRYMGYFVTDPEPYYLRFIYVDGCSLKEIKDQFKAYPTFKDLENPELQDNFVNKNADMYGGYYRSTGLEPVTAPPSCDDDE